MKAKGIMPHINTDPVYSIFHFEFSVKPKVFNADCTPCFKCEAINKIAMI